MTKDKALEELFLAQKPHFSDKADFMASLTKRLDAVEYLKQHQEATIRRYKMMMVIAFVVGIICGAVYVIKHSLVIEARDTNCVVVLAGSFDSQVI